MKQQYAVIVLFALIIASTLTSLDSFRSTKRMVNEDMDRALAIAMQEQKSDVISVDTIRVFNSHLQMEALRGRAVLTVDTKIGFSPRPHDRLCQVTWLPLRAYPMLMGMGTSQ